MNQRFNPYLQMKGLRILHCVARYRKLTWDDKAVLSQLMEFNGEDKKTPDIVSALMEELALTEEEVTDSIRHLQTKEFIELIKVGENQYDYDILPHKVFFAKSIEEVASL